MVIVSLCLLLAVPITPAAAQPRDRYAAIDAYVQERMRATQVPGLSYAVVGPGGPLHQRSWGVDGRGGRVTADTPFLWGSVSKPIAATGIMTLVESGRIHLDDKVTDHLPGFRFGGTAHASKVTVRHLLDHTSGLPESATFQVTDCLAPDCPPPAGRIGDLDEVTPLGPPGSTYAYTSANYLVLAAVVESVTARPFPEYLRDAVLDPAGMHGAIADAASARERNLPPGHQFLWGAPSAIADGVDTHGAAYGYLGGDLGNLSAFASLQLRSGRLARGGNVLTSDSVRLMREEGRLQPTGTGTGYGLGWRVGGLDAPLDGAIWHTGATFGYSATLLLLPQHDLALVLQQNLHGPLHDEAVMQTGFGAARLLAGAQPPTDASTLGYHLTTWGVTTLALGLILAAGRSAVLLRRLSRPASPLRRTTLVTMWSLAGALPWIVLVPLAGETGPRRLTMWLPDVSLALYAAAAAGAVTVALRLALAVRTPSSNHPRPGANRH
ncbi:beta-lactamase family protein [Nonomuraea sp. KC401]|uniref:serine hydrolase domain-containing protein n=1 Tax=unclassified Nonomuraea TaxID=2593643 RepID=UPI0010FEA40B|nr:MULTISPECIES: serine hydrolase domain-containing protein [unclassified Nonomuraea]NBE97051.1 serine hydrolase [Nonomuraea sp. K271]TLF66206.1 beta-lactamase family protein [Nonomuraea sp. KC401]